MDSIKSLRESAARLKADVLLIYTFDTSFHVGGQSYVPLSAISLVFLKNKEVTVTTTVSAALFDVRTESLFCLSEATAKESNNSSVWSTSAEVDDMRVSTEKLAFEQLIPEVEKTWSAILKQYASASI
ncbi:hypothetical protein [Teredinibacter turnerae]|uniref:hypothetical protein n=1 Tax=Teredinibacter turnerae TaxID=2426 RepID=UPI0030D47E7B